MFNVHMFKKKFWMLQENIGTNAKSCEICNEKTQFFFFFEKLDSEKNL